MENCGEKYNDDILNINSKLKEKFLIELSEYEKKILLLIDDEQIKINMLRNLIKQNNVRLYNLSKRIVM